MSLLEKVARRLFEREQGDNVWEAVDENVRTHYKLMAMAAIDTMLEWMRDRG